MNARIVAQIRRVRPDLGVVDRFLYFQPVEKILCGFVYEQSREADFVWRYALPLYDKLPFLHLAFGDRIRSWIKLESRAPGPREKVVRFLGVVDELETEVRGLRDPENFLRVAEQPERIKNPWVRRGAALTHIVIGNRDAAASHLLMLIEGGQIDKLANFREEISLVYGNLMRGIEHARMLLEDWEMSTKRKYSLST